MSNPWEQDWSGVSSGDGGPWTKQWADQQAAAAPQSAVTASLNDMPLFSSGLGREALQGLTLGFGDELLGAGRAAWDTITNGESYSDAYKRKIADERLQLERYRRAHPAASIAANVAGGVPLMFVPGLNVARGANLARTLGNAARVGATAGLIAGVGSGEDVEDRLKRGGIGALAGGTLGLAVPAVGAGLSRGAQAVADLNAGNVVGRIAGAMPGVTAPGASRAEQEVLLRLQRDGIPIEKAAQMIADWKATGKPFTLADIGGMNTQGLADAAMAVPNAARQRVSDQLTERAAEQGERIATDLTRGTGVLSDAFDTAKKIQAERAAQAAPLYAKAYEAGKNSITDPRIMEILSLPRFQSILKRAADIAQLEGNPLAVAPDGRIIPNLHALDVVKRGIDDELFTGRATGALGREEQRALDGVRREMLTILDKKFPEYAKARAVYAGHTRALEAQQDGSEFWNSDPREIRDQLAHEYKTPAERDSYLIGAVDQIRTMVKQSPDGADIYKRVFGSPQKRELLRLLFPNQDSYDNFVRAMSVEKAMRRTQDFIRGNSRTVSRAEEVDSLGSNAAELLEPRKLVVNKLSQPLFSRVKGKNAEGVLPLLFDDPEASLRALRRMQLDLDEAARRPLRIAPGMGVTGGLLGQ